MDLQKVIDALGEASRRTRSDYHVTLGAMIEKLKTFDQDAVVVCSDDEQQSPGNAMSYRGYYADLCFEPEETTRTVSELVQECERALGKSFEGYKGGDFCMGPDTPLWIAPYGTSMGRAIIDVIQADKRVMLVIKRVGDY